MKRVVSILLVAVMLLSLAACGQGSTPEATKAPDATKAPVATDNMANTGAEIVAGGDDLYEKKTPEGELIFGTNQTIKPLNPTTAQDNTGIYMVYETLWTLNAETNEFEPQLAKEWEWTDARTLSITLRDDVYFHSGDKLTADDVLYTIERLLDPVLSTRVMMRWSMVDLEKTEVVDDTHIIVRLNADSGTLMSEFASCTGVIANRSHCEKVGEDGFWDNVDGTGPFKLVSSVTGDSQVYELNENYWGEKPNFNKVTWRYYAEVTTMFIDYENGDIDGCFGAAAEDAQRIIDGTVDHSSLYIVPEHRLYYLAMFGLNDALKDQRVREALAHAIDVDALADVSFGLLGTAADSLFAAGVNYAIPFERYEYNPERAKELLKEAGYETGLTFKMTCNNQAATTRLGEAFQAMLNDVGIKLEVGFFDTATHIGNVQGVGSSNVCDYDFTFNSITVDSLDPNQQWATSEKNSGHQIGEIRDDEIQEYLIAGKTTSDNEARKDAYAKFQTAVHDKCWAVPIVNSCGAVILRDYFEQVTVSDPRMPKVAEFRLK